MKTIIITDFEQGENEKIAKTGYISAFSTDSVTFEISAEKTVQFALFGYDKAKNELFSLDWHDGGYTANLLKSSYNNARYWCLSIKYKDNSEITPSDLGNLTITVKNYWYIDENGSLRFEDMPYAPEKYLTKPYPSALWRVVGDVPAHEVYPEIPENAVKLPFPLALWRIDYLSPNMPYHRLMPNIKGINMWNLPPENVIRVYDYQERQDGFKHNGLAILAPSECTSYHELNGRWDVELTHPVEDWGRWKTLLPQNVLKINGQLFRIDEHTSVSGTGGIYIKVHAKHISYDLADEFIHYYQGENLNGYEFIRAMFGACLTDVDHYDKYIFHYDSDIEDRTGQVEISDKSLLNALIGNDECLINQLGGELYRDNFYFSINKRMEGAKDNAFALKYGFDMVGITQKIDYSELSTWLMVDDNYGDCWSVSYVNDVYPIHHHKHVFRHFNYSDSNDSYNRLVRDGQDLFGQICRPKVTYEVNIANLQNSPKYSGFLELQNYNLGDKGTIECELLDIKTTQEIIAVQKNELTGEIKKIKLGSENYSLVRPSYKSDTISTQTLPAMEAMQKQLDELNFREYINTPITAGNGEYLTSSDGKYLIYRG